jgi:hypothetical protein
MRASVSRFGAVVLAGAAVLFASPASAQIPRAVNPALFGYGRHPITLPPGIHNPYTTNPYLINPALMRQAAAAGAGFAAGASIPPYTIGAPLRPASLAGGYPAGAALVASGYPSAGYGDPYAASLATTGYPSAGYGAGGYDYVGYGNPYPYMPYYGYLRGVADITTAQAEYWKTIQEARLLREQSYRSALDTAHKMIEEAAYERGEWLNRVDPEKNRQKDQAWWLDRARHNPPPTEIYSARSLNDLLDHLKMVQGAGQAGPHVPLDQDLLRGVNLTGQDTRANIGLLKEGKLHWPLPLQGSEFADGRERLERLIADAVNEARFGNTADPGKLRDMHAELGRLNQALHGAVGELSPSRYVEARRYLNLLGDAVKALEDPKVVNYFNQNWVAKSKNVAELVKFMSDKGLRFAPATPGDADAYRSLYDALAAFDARMPQQAAIETAAADDSDARRKQGGQAAPPEPRPANPPGGGDGILARAAHETGLIVEVLEVRPDRNEMLYIRWRYRNPTENPIQLIAATPRFQGTETPPNTAEKFLAAVYYSEGKIETDPASRHSVVRQAGTGLPIAKDLGKAAVVIRPGQQFEVWAKFTLPHARTEKTITFHVMGTPPLEDVPIQAGKE